MTPWEFLHPAHSLNWPCQVANSQTNIPSWKADPLIHLTSMYPSYSSRCKSRPFDWATRPQKESEANGISHKFAPLSVGRVATWCVASRCKGHWSICSRCCSTRRLTAALDSNPFIEAPKILDGNFKHLKACVIFTFLSGVCLSRKEILETGHTSKRMHHLRLKPVLW